MWHFQKYKDAPLLLRQLITNITNLQEGTERFQRLEEHAIHELKVADSMVFVSKKDLDAIMSSTSDKFIFHGFCSQAEDLRSAYKRFIPSNLSKEDTDHKIIILRFLLSLSESPTKSFSLFPSDCTHTADEDVIDWPAYLREGIERWSPLMDEISESWSDESRLSESSMDACNYEEPARHTLVTNQKKSFTKDVLQEYVHVRETLVDYVQNTWFTQEHVYMVPPSDNVDANIALLWGDFLQYCTKDLVELRKSKIITEYKVMREIFWQMWEPHTSFAFEIVINDLLPQTNITISSVRPEPFKRFLHEFLPYVRLLQDFKDFHASLTPSQDKVANEVIPETYRSYDFAVSNIIKPVYVELLRLEEEVMGQKSLISLLQLADRFRKLFKNAQVIKMIHERVVLDLKTNSPVRCATTLLARLHTGLLHCINKNEQDIYLSIYLESLYQYFAIINSWLSQDVLIDLSKEFIIADENPKDPHVMSMCNNSFVNQSENPLAADSFNERGHSDWQMNFMIRDLDETAKADGLLKIMYTEVLQIGKNIHLLRLLKKLHLLKDSANTMTLHEELIARVLREMAEYFEVTDDSDCELELEDSGVTFKFPAICSDDCKYPTEMDRLENLVDTSDGFLMNAFSSYFTEEEKTPILNEQSLYDRISNITNNMFPAKQIVDSVFLQILHERYSESGYMVKSLLTDEYHIEKHLQLLQHVYLFKDDIIFLLYRRVFQQMELDGWDSEAWLTNQLQDTLVNIYPDFCENCVVKVKETLFLTHDPLQVCSQLTIEYKIDWPTNIIIRNKHMEMYTELFHVILQIKWGLYTLNHLYFDEIELKRRPQNQRKIMRDMITKLKVLRFCLLKEFSSIQHYVLGFVYNKCFGKFCKDFERAYNLDTLIAAHDDFISDIYSTIMGIKGLDGSTYGFDLILHLVRKLSAMWANLKSINYEELKQCELMYRKCHEYLDLIMQPKDICFDYN